MRCRCAPLGHNVSITPASSVLSDYMLNRSVDIIGELGRPCECRDFSQHSPISTCVYEDPQLNAISSGASYRSSPMKLASRLQVASETASRSQPRHCHWMWQPLVPSGLCPSISDIVFPSSFVSWFEFGTPPPTNDAPSFPLPSHVPG